MNRRLSLTLLCLFFEASAALRADDWPQWLGPNRDGVWREKDIVTQIPKDLKVRWRVPVKVGYSGPAVVGNRLYLTDWSLEQGQKNPDNPFARGNTSGNERVLCLDADTGKQVWSHNYPAVYKISYPGGPRATPLVDGEKVYTLGAMGHLHCLATKNGEVVWKKDLVAEFKAEVPLWGFSAHPLVDGSKLITLVGGSGSAVVAFNKDTGAEIWRSLTTENIGYCPPMIYEFGGKRQLIIWESSAIHGLDPETGKSLWRQPFKLQAALSIPTPRKVNDMLFVTAFYNGPMLLKVGADSVSVVWKGTSNSEQPKLTDKLHSIMTTPFIKDGHIYGICSYGQMRCLKLADGMRVWESLQATSGDRPVRWAHAFLVEHEDRWFLFNEKGEILSAMLSPKGYEETGRAKVLEPTGTALGRDVVWMHPAFANQAMYARNDKELVCVSLAAKDYAK